ncbi:MAG: AraC family transcriptional regulator [Gammaproteobacteria bacterium]|nr:MAG: AraC family transcriptional regulator [Gammaproteobacteria bacterium]
MKGSLLNNETDQPKLKALYSYIEMNLDGDLSLNNLAVQFGFSKYHLQRQFNAYYGISIFSLVKALRFKRATYQLAFRHNIKIIDIAFEAGFESSESFSRAFKEQFNLSPREFQKKPLDSSWETSFNQLNQLRKKSMQTEFRMSDVNIVEFNKTKVAVLEHKGSPALLGSSIQKFISWRKDNKLPPSKSRTFNFVYDDPQTTAPDDYRFDIACSIESEIEEGSTGIINRTIPHGRCALLRVIGADTQLGAAIEFLYSNWLELSDEKIRDFPLFFHRVSFFPNVTENEMVTDIYLPIE